MTTNHKGMTQAVIAKNESRTHWFAANLSLDGYLSGDPRRAQVFQTCLAELYKLAWLRQIYCRTEAVQPSEWRLHKEMFTALRSARAR